MALQAATLSATGTSASLAMSNIRAASRLARNADFAGSVALSNCKPFALRAPMRTNDLPAKAAEESSSSLGMAKQVTYTASTGNRKPLPPCSTWNNYTRNLTPVIYPPFRVDYTCEFTP